MGLTSKYDVFIWDFDGTLFNTYPQITEGYMRVIREYGFDESAAEVERLARISFGTLDAHLRDKFGAGEAFFRKAGELRRDLAIKYSEPFPEAKRFVFDSLAEGGRHMIFTHRDERVLEMLDRGFGAGVFSDVIYAGSEGFAWKPSPDALNALIERNSLDKRRAIMIGDREIDVVSGKNAGIDSCLIMPYDIAAESCATYKCATFDDLRRALCEQA